MNTDRLLTIAETACGPDARQRVFEPLVADWQREWSDATPARRVVITLSGFWAFVLSMVRCFHTAHLVTARPAAGFVFVLVVFAVAGSVLSLQPLQFTWLGAGIQLLWVPTGQVLYVLPNALAYMAVFALFPALLLAQAAGWCRRRVVVALATTLTVIVVVEGWVAPVVQRAGDLQLDESATGSAVQRIRLFANTSEVIELTSSDNPLYARVAGQELERKAELFALALSLGWLGLAVGRLRGAVGPRPSMLRLAVCWWSGWATYVTLRYWSQYGLMLLDLPATSRPWVVPLVFLVAGCGLFLLTRESGTEVPPSSGQRAVPA